MTKQDIFNYFYTNSANFGVTRILMTMLGGLLIGLIIYLTYKVSHRGVTYNQKFNSMLVIVLQISIVIMLMISSNIVISLGMVGALSIVRFRTAIKDPRDTIFMFWAISEGLSTGSGNFLLSLVTTIFIAIVIILFDFIIHKKNKYIVVITGGKEKINLEEVEFILSSFTNEKKLRCANQNDNHQEYIYEVKSLNDINEEFLSQIHDVKGVKTANFLLETGESIG